MKFDLIIFDNDGVLVDSEPIACDVLARVLTECGIPTTFDDVVANYLGGSISRTRRMGEEILGRGLPPDFEDRFHEGLFARLETELRAVEGIPDVLDRLDIVSARYCVASSGSPERIRRSLSAAGLIDRFDDDQIFSASDVARGKPHPDLFLMAAERMEADPGRCVVVEDSPLGIEAANRAGMASVGFASLQSSEKLSAASLGVVDTMADLPGMLR